MRENPSGLLCWNTYIDSEHMGHRCARAVEHRGCCRCYCGRIWQTRTAPERYNWCKYLREQEPPNLIDRPARRIKL